MSELMMRDEPQHIDGVRLVRRILRLWRRHALLFALVTLGVMLAGFAVLFTLKPSYTATATVAISTGAADPLAPSGQQQPDRLEDDRPATEAAMLQSRDVAAAVLRQYPPLPETGGLHLRRRFCDAGLRLFCPRPDTSTPEQKFQGQIDAFLGSLLVVPEMRSRVIDVTVKARTGQRAADLANAVVAHYQQISLDRQTTDIDRVTSWLDQRTEQLRQRWLDTVRNANTYDVRHNLTNTGDGTAANPLIDTQISQVAINLSQAQARLAAAQARSQALGNAVGQGDPRSVVALSQQPILVATANALQQLRSQRDQLAARFGSSYPGIQALDRQIASAQGSLASETRGALTSIREDTVAAQAEVNQLGASLDRLRAQAGQQSGSQAEYASLNQEAQSARTVYETFLDHAKTVVDRAALLQPPVEVVSHAPVPGRASFPNHLKLGLGVIVVALMCGAAAVVLRSLFSTSLNEVSDLKGLTRLPILAEIPMLAAQPTRTILRHVQLEPFSRTSEIVRGLAAQLCLIGSGASNARSILITSASPQEGKSTLALWLGLTIRQGGHRTIVIDTDYRQSAVRHTLHGQKTRGGFADLLLGQATLSEVIQSDADTKIDFIAAGSTVAHPFGVEDIDRLRALIATLKQTYNTVILDSPPMLVMTDALVYSRVVDSTVFVCRWQHSSRQAVSACLERLHLFGASLSGIVMAMAPAGLLGDGYSRRDLALINQAYGD